MQQKRRAAAVFLFAVLVPLAGGCSGVSTPGPQEPEDKPFARVRLRVACPDEVTRLLLAEVSKGWAHRAGAAAVETAMYSPSGLTVPDAAADVWILPASELPRWASAERLTPLPACMTDKTGSAGWGSLLPIYREQLLQWDGTAYAVPLLGDAPLCFYRRDLLSDSVHRDAFARRTGRKLEPPASWEEYAAIAEYFRDSLSSVASLPSLPASDAELDRLFYTVAASSARRMAAADAQEEATDADLFTFHFDQESGRARISSPGFVHALRLLQRLQACRPPANHPHPWKNFRDKQAVLCLGDARLLGEFQAVNSPVRGKTGVCLVPGSRVFFDVGTREKRTFGEGSVNRVPYLGAGAYVLAVPRSARQPDAAFDFLAEIAGREQTQQIVLDSRWAGGATRPEHLNEYWDGWQLPQDESERARTAIRETIQHNLRNPLLCLRLPRAHDFSAALTAELRPALMQAKAATDDGAATVLQAVARRWDELIQPRLLDHRREYRVSLGLASAK